MTEHVAPQEDQFQLPTGWGGRLLSRRGRRTGKPVELDQLARPVLAFAPGFEGVTVDVGRVLRMVKRGWNRAAPHDCGVEPGIYFPLPGGYVTVTLDPGVRAGAVGETLEQTVQSVQLTDTQQYWWSGRVESNRKYPKKIDEVAAAEVLGSPARLTGRS